MYVMQIYLLCRQTTQNGHFLTILIQSNLGQETTLLLRLELEGVQFFWTRGLASPGLAGSRGLVSLTKQSFNSALARPLKWIRTN